MGVASSPETKTGKRNEWFSSRIIFAPFGRYQGDKPADLSADGLLIGREEQRAQLIRALLDNTHRGAYLVTGHRGSGKTTLVKHCLQEYEEAAYERYLNRHVGRSLLWDRLALFVFTGFMLFSLLMLHDLLDVLIKPALGFEPFLTVVILAIVAVLLIPFLMAWSTLAFVAECISNVAWQSAAKFSLFLGSGVLAFLTMALSESQLGMLPALTMLVSVAALPFAAILSIQLVGESPGRWASIFRISLVLVQVAFVSLLAFFFSSHWIWYIFALQLFLAAMIAHHSQYTKNPDRHRTERLTFYLTTFLLLTILGFGVVYVANPRAFVSMGYLTASLVLMSLALLISGWSSNAIPRIKQHKPLLLLFFKGLSLLILGLHLIAPVWNFIISRPEFPELLKEIADSLPTWGRPTMSLNSSAWEWIFSAAALLSALFFLEFEWIARTRSEYRKDRPLVNDVVWSLGRYRGGTYPPSLPAGKYLKWREIRTLEKRLFELTFFYSIFRHWNPLLVVPVNLGFDSLDHKRVIEAMLSCLRDEFEKSFISWRSPIESTKNVVLFLLSLYLTFALSFHVFHINEASHQDLQAGQYCESLKNALDPLLSSPPGMLLSCWIGGEPFSRILQSALLYRSPPSKEPEPKPGDVPGPPDASAEQAFRVSGIRVPSQSLVARSIQELGASSPDGSTFLVLRTYHLILFLLVLGTFQFLTRRYWPYYKTAIRLQTLLHGLTGRMREDSVEAQSIWSRLLNVFAGREKARMVEAEPGDPRAVEVATLAIMAKMQSLNVEVPYSARHALNLPAPEIIFKLDELDKLGVGVIPEHDSSGPEVEPTQGLDLERRRSKALHNLFAEMKNILASGVARFIFIGGRNLHDEWLADLSSRRPLLANIFEVELHLPSLLTEAVEEKGTIRLNTNIQWFVEHLFEECKRNQERSNLQRMFYVHKGPQGNFPFLYSQTHRSDTIESFEKNFGSSSNQYGVHPFQFRTVPAWQALSLGEVQETSPESSQAWLVFDDFVDFLSYRSRGNPRRLTALVESFLRDSISLRRDFVVTGLSCPDSISGFLSHDDQDDHVLVFKDLDLYRVQLVAEVYRRFRDSLGMRFDFRDDKLIAGALHVSDFLLKFHRRAFGWGNLQRVDELVHIHRAPDLPQVFSQIIDSFAERYLHTIRNGMYDYRFSSDFSRELRYLSRHSEEELAAVNFTLDESQALKAIYRARFKQLQDNQAYEFISALGELHEFDEEYEIARFYYRKAISYLDARLKNEIQLFEEDSVLHLVLTQKNEGLEIAKRRLNWALARLRINLQVGMSYERSEDFEQAQAHYRNARTFAAAILRALLNSEEKDGELIIPQSPDRGRPDFMSTLKHFNLLFQPMLAEAWICEKLRSGIDTSVRVVERSIWEVRWILPAVREEFDGDNPALAAGGLFSFRYQHLNFYLTMAEQHNKAGDLMFFKGCPSILPAGSAGPPKALRAFGGFLGRAHYHYAVSVHEIRSFIALRRERLARIQYPDTTFLDGAQAPPDQLWPDYLVDCASDSLADLADTLAARVSLRDLLITAEGAGSAGIESQEAALKKAWITFRQWSETLPGGIPETPDPAVAASWSKLTKDLIAGGAGYPLHAVVGQRQAAWLVGRQRPVKPVSRKQALALESEFARQSEDRVRRRYRDLAQGDVQPLIDLNLELAGPSLLANYTAFLWIASKILEEGGHYEDAARKASRIVEIVVQYLLMARVVRWSQNFRKVVNAGPPVAGGWAEHFESASFDTATLSDLVGIGVLAAEAAVEQFHRARFRFVDFEQVRTRNGLEGFAVGRLAPTALCAHICALGIHSMELLASQNCANRLANLCIQVSGGQGRADAGKELQVFKDVLRCSLERNAYPIFGRLHGLKVLADDLLISTELASLAGKDLEDTLVARVAELEETADAFDAPLHFTAFHFGTTRALHALVVSCTGSAGERTNLRRDRLLSARETLRGSIAMFSMQNTFYRTIDQLYYLYDDFNDRRVHSCHAQQLAGAELTALLIETIEERLLGLSKEKIK